MHDVDIIFVNECLRKSRDELGLNSLTALIIKISKDFRENHVETSINLELLIVIHSQRSL